MKACLRGDDSFPKRVYLTCNPGGIGHAWVKRLFIDRAFRGDEKPEDYRFIAATVEDNDYLTKHCPEYLQQLRSLPEPLRSAWLCGSWDLFEGQFFPELCDAHFLPPPLREELCGCRFFGAMDYGFDMLALLLFAVRDDGTITVLAEYACPNLTLSEAAEKAVALFRDYPVEYIAASPDLWNRRQDTGYSGDEILSRNPGLPPLIRADNRRVEGWRAVRELLRLGESEAPRLRFSRACRELRRCLSALTVDSRVPEDAASRPHEITHLPEALRYGIMSRMADSVFAADGDDGGNAALIDRFFGRKAGREDGISIYSY